MNFALIICLCRVKALTNRILVLYTADAPKWDNISDLASSLGWLDLVRNSTAHYLMAQGVSKEYTHELVEAATRVNYGQVRIHPLLIACLRLIFHNRM
jgi:prenylcysteine oxidase/farnesylcysteine lyase